MAEGTLPMLGEVKVKTEVEEVPWDVITIITDLKIITGEETGALLEVIIMDNKEIDIGNMSPKIGHGITKMDKEGDIIIEIMTI